MTTRGPDWFRQAEADLRLARNSLRDGDHEWACFAAQQSAEKAAKAAHAALGQEAWGHVVTELLDVRGAPTDFYTRPEAEWAIADAEAVLAVCRRVLSRT